MTTNFSTSINGYNKLEVNKFVSDVTKEYESMLNRLKSTDALNESLKKQLEEAKEMESTFKKSLMVAEQANKELKKVAQNESIAILEDARKNASRIVNDALLKAQRIENDADTLKRRAILYKRRIKQLLDEESVMLDKLDTLDME
jgi:cell division initiation protein